MGGDRLLVRLPALHQWEEGPARAERFRVCWMGVRTLRTCTGQGGSPLSNLLGYALWFPHGRDGVPPYRLRKQHRREMQESAKANGRVPLPHIPVRGLEHFGGAALFPRVFLSWCPAVTAQADSGLKRSAGLSPAQLQSCFPPWSPFFSPTGPSQLVPLAPLSECLQTWPLPFPPQKQILSGLFIYFGARGSLWAALVESLGVPGASRAH